MKPRKVSIELGLEVIEALRPADVRLSAEDIAAVCGCSREAIRLIEVRALAKLRAALARREHGVPKGVPCPPSRYRLAVAAFNAKNFQTIRALPERRRATAAENRKSRTGRRANTPPTRYKKSVPTPAGASLAEAGGKNYASPAPYVAPRIVRSAAQITGAGHISKRRVAA